MHTKSLTALSAGLAKKEFSSLELTQHFLDRISKFDKNLNSFITVTKDHALEQAKIADQRLATGTATPLTGIPFAQKDIFCTNGILTTCASKILANFKAPYNATIVENMNHAGMVMLGKTHMDEFAMGGSNENSYYGPVKNPWNHDYVPGGSSGGSAAAVAARLVPAATGTDTGGSIRQPAAFCGLTGLKPTYGRVSRYGMVAYASSLDSAGPMGLSAADVALLFGAMAGFDNKDSTSINHPVEDYSKALDNSIKGLHIGVPQEFLGPGLNEEVAQALEGAIKIFEKLGATIHSISLPHNRLAVPVYYTISPAEASSNLARYDGVRYGYRCEDPKSIEDLYGRTRDTAFGQEVKRRIMVGTFALSSGYYDAYYIKAQKIRQLIKKEHQQVFEEKKIDIILGPTTPSPAFKLGEKSDPISMYLLDTYTIPNNLAGFPGISIPAGFVNGLPIGIQLTGHYFAEAKLLNIAHQYQQETDWHLAIPDLYK
jgi:aspartyl-tRNA(Asn)/glutamyl-tRNA(Gln) amidotransferase subunit A